MRVALNFYATDGSLMNFENMKEVDVREDIAMPVLRALGYEKGTNNDILREEELRLRYPRPFLGRKKPGKDPILRGKPDYVLSVLGVCRWVFEIKAPSEPLDLDAIEQAITYARHPEVNGTFVALLNGREFVLFESMQSADDTPLLRIDECSVSSLVARLDNILSPVALQRDQRKSEIDFGQSLGGNLRSSEKITGGLIQYSMTDWSISECPELLIAEVAKGFEPLPKLFDGMQSSINGGVVERGVDGLPVAKLGWNSPYAQLGKFVDEKRLNEINYVCLDPQISSDEENPSTFDFFTSVYVDHGEEVYDLIKHEVLIMEAPATVEMRGQAVGYIEGRELHGIFQTETSMHMDMPNFRLRAAFFNAGTFIVSI